MTQGGAEDLGHGLAGRLLAAAAVVWLAAFSLSINGSRLADAEHGPMVVVLRPGTTDAEAISAIGRAGGSVVAPVAGTSFVWSAVGDRPGFVGRVRSEGAMVAFRNLPVVTMLVGCMPALFAQTRPDISLR